MTSDEPKIKIENGEDFFIIPIPKNWLTNIGWDIENDLEINISITKNKIIMTKKE